MSLNGIGQTLRKAVLANIFTGGSLTAQTAWHISATTSTGPGTDGGAGANEVGGGVGYARVNYTGGWSAPTSADPSVVTNSADIVFPAATGSWGTITSCGVWNHATNTAAANFLAAADLTPDQAVSAGNVMVIPAGTLSIQLGNTP